jgi:phosphate-selective porin OprO/OprP
MSFSFARVFVAAAIGAASVFAAPPPAAAQAPAPPPVQAQSSASAPAPTQAPSASTPASATAPQAPAAQASPVAGFQDGFFIQNANGDNRLVFGMIGQMDGRFSLDDPKPITNTFTIRKFRPTLSGRVARYFDFKFMPDFGNGTTVVQDAYVDVRFSTKFRVRTGKDKTPIGHELLIGDAYLLFPERALASSLVPNRDIGVAVQGDLAGTRVFYAAGVYNGVPDGASTTTEVDTNNGKDLAGRIVVNPFRDPKRPARALNGLGFQVGGSTGKESGALPAFRTSVGQTYFSYATGAAASGTRTRVTPAVFYYYKGFGGYAEWIQSSQGVTRNAVETDVTNQAWEVTASYLLTGETASAGITRPKAAFDPAKGQWGALQLVARYTALTVDDSVFSAGLAGTGANRDAKSFTIAANWYPTPYIKYYATFERTTFGGGATARPDENVILFRTQLAF